jgi:hypothetical protein
MGAIRITALALTACALALPARAEIVEMRAELSARNEVPPVSSTATGQGQVRFDTATGALSWTITYSGLSAPLSAAHFHGPAATEGNAPVLVPIATAGAPSPLTGSATIDPAQAAALLAGRWYINLHTPNNPGGEIRGQVVRR